MFLRHVERVGCIAYVLDLSGGQKEGDSLLDLTPAQQLAVLQVTVHGMQILLLYVNNMMLCVLKFNKPMFD